MSEKRILLASLLKPINDTRLYEKLGLSLSKVPGITVHICGYEAPLPANAPGNIHFHPLFRFGRLSAGRAKAQATFYQLLVKVNPEVIIASTHELLLVSLAYKMRHGGKIIYDIQENYSLNLRAQHNYPWLLKHLMAHTVRAVEQLTAPGIDHFLLAERSYADELPFLGKRYTLLENKYKAPAISWLPTTPVTLPAEGPLRLLFSGTIAEEYGIWEAIALAAQWQAQRPDVKLTIIGYCANAHTLHRLQQVCRQKPFIELIGGDRLVPHTRILEAVRQSHLGLLPYRPNSSTFRCIPTKLYEYMAHGLPILIQHNPLWQTIVDGNSAGLSTDFQHAGTVAQLSQLYQATFYTNGIPGDIYWESEEKKLLALMQTILP